MSPADAARKKMSHSRQNTARWRSPSAGAGAGVAASSVTPERAVSHALVAPVMARTAASPASATRTPTARMDQPKAGAAIMAPAGSRLTR
jgi:hypothetical protein